jgi:hypothetical protein
MMHSGTGSWRNCMMMFRIFTLHQIIYGSNQGEWGASEIQYVWERWEKHIEF